ncbi:MAG: GGDEF domain-containing protein [Gammaproteobacteria bacterium]|nr:GGDEF domain-containing protein [Gammaproteobacteria bacterium]
MTLGESRNFSDPKIYPLLFTSTFLLISTVFLIVFAIIHFWQGARWLGFIQAALVIVNIFSTYFLHRTNNIELTGSIILTGMIVLLTAIIIHGGINNSGPYWIGVFPILVFLLKGKDKGPFWILAMFSILLILMALQAMDIYATPFSIASLAILNASYIGITALTFFYELIRTRSAEVITRQAQQLQEHNTRLHREIQERTAIEAALRESDKRLRHLAHHDPLTGLPNRLLFFDRLNQAVATAKRQRRQVAVLFLDLDKFKPINDKLGHEIGDQLLHDTAERLQHCVRTEDTAARYGGDEFTMILAELGDEKDSISVAKKLIDSLEKPFHIGGHTCRISASIGVAIYPQHGKEPDSLVSWADTAMYRAKKDKKSKYRISMQEDRDD